MYKIQDLFEGRWADLSEEFPTPGEAGARAELLSRSARATVRVVDEDDKVVSTFVNGKAKDLG